MTFLSTPSARRATPSSPSLPAAIRFLSTPSARRATPGRCRSGAHSPISIHALREEGDNRPQGREDHPGNFYPRPPRGGRPIYDASDVNPETDFYPRPPRGGRLNDIILIGLGKRISIHALREEGDRWAGSRPTIRHYFYPRPPRGGRQISQRIKEQLTRISIHALREEGDSRKRL